MKIEEIFQQAEDGRLSYDEFMELAKEASFVDLKEGNYVSKQKYEDELGAKAKEIENLNGTLGTRDTDLAELQKRLEEAGTDSEKLSQLTTDLNSLQSKYTEEVKSYKDQLRRQAYEFAVKEYAGTKKFSSEAARRDFISQMKAEDLKMDGDTILGAADFAEAYAKANEDAFVIEAPAAQPEEDLTKPHFIGSTPGVEEYKDPTGGFADAFNFVNLHPEK